MRLRGLGPFPREHTRRFAPIDLNLAFLLLIIARVLPQSESESGVRAYPGVEERDTLERCRKHSKVRTTCKVLRPIFSVLAQPSFDLTSTTNKLAETVVKVAHGSR